MAQGEPGFPRRFRWRGQEYELRGVLEKWKEAGPCRSGGREQYVRKHWFRIRTAGDVEMTVYFERQSRSRRESKTRWWLHSIDTPAAE